MFSSQKFLKNVVFYEKLDSLFFDSSKLRQLHYKAGIYCFVNNVVNIFYRGHSKNIRQRILGHQKKTNKNLQLAWKKNFDYFYFYVLKFCEIDPKFTKTESSEFLCKREQFYLDKIPLSNRSTISEKTGQAPWEPPFFKGTRYKKVGNNHHMFSKKHSPETILKFSRAKTGTKLSPFTKEKN